MKTRSSRARIEVTALDGARENSRHIVLLITPESIANPWVDQLITAAVHLDPDGKRAPPDPGQAGARGGVQDSAQRAKTDPGRSDRCEVRRGSNTTVFSTPSASRPSHYPACPRPKLIGTRTRLFLCIRWYRGRRHAYGF